MKTNHHQLYTAQDAARELGCTDARIRQICGDPAVKIGRKHGVAWALTDVDLEQLRGLMRKSKKK